MLIAIVLVVVLGASVLTACKKDQKPGGSGTTDKPAGSVNNDFKVGGQVIIGSSTELSGDFRWPGYGTGSAGASDQDIAKLTTGYSTMESNQGGQYVWNQTAVKSHTEEEIDHADGTKTLKITIEINPGLKMSGGTEIKADNYLAYILAMSTPVANKALDSANAGESFVGYKKFNAYDGTNAGEKASKEFAGLRRLGDYKFSMEIDSEFYPYYFADTFGAVTPYDLKLVLGGAQVKDDGNGAYLSDDWYAVNVDKDKKPIPGDFVKINHLKEARFDYYTYEYTGPYTLDRWNATSKEAILKINGNFAGNFEGQKPHVEKVIYRKVVEETQIAQLSRGEIDILEGLTGAASVNAALQLTKGENAGFKEVHYDRAGYGKVQFDCDFSPTMFAEVRQAIAYCFDREEFANTFCGGFGSVVNGPYSVNFPAYVANEDLLEEKLKSYSVSTAAAKKALQEGGWVYNADGSAYNDSVGGIRYKKLSAAEATKYNINYKAVSVTTSNLPDKTKEYKTVKVGDDYYMPCVVNWFSSENNPVSDLLTQNLLHKGYLTEAGVGMTKTEGTFTALQAQIKRKGSDFTGDPTYSMFNLATGWNNAVYDYAYNWIDNSNEELYKNYFGYSTNKLSDPYDKEFSWWNKENQGLSYDAAMKKSNGKLGMNYISFAMVYSTKVGDTAEYNKWFAAYMLRWNELLPDIPLYGNIYYDCYNAKILNFKATPFFGAANAILYCATSDAQ